MPKAVWTLLVFSVLTAGAHTLPISYLLVVCDRDYAHFELTLNPFELNSFAELDRNRNRRLDPADLKENETALRQKLQDSLIVRVDGKVIGAETSGVTLDGDSQHLTFNAHYRVDAREARLTIESSLAAITSASHITQLKVLRNGRLELAQLDAQSARVAFESPRPRTTGTVKVSNRAASISIGSLLLLMALPGMVIFGVVAFLILRSLRRIPSGAPEPTLASSPTKL